MIKQDKVGKTQSNEILPGGVPQQSLLSSICSTSNPMNHEPNETSSLIYLCRICLVSWISGNYVSERIQTGLYLEKSEIQIIAHLFIDM
jgi:hypothetical protein